MDSRNNERIKIGNMAENRVGTSEIGFGTGAE